MDLTHIHTGFDFRSILEKQKLVLLEFLCSTESTGFCLYEGLGIFKNEFKKGTISAYVFACVGEDHFVKKNVFGAQGADTKGLA